MEHDDDDASSARPDGRPGRTGALVAFAVVAALAIVAGIVLWTGGDDEVTSPTTASLVTGTALSPVDTTITTVTTVTTPASTTSGSVGTTASTVGATSATTGPTGAPTTTPPATGPPVFELPPPGATTWTVTLRTGQQLALVLADSDGDVGVYDGEVDGLRCVVVVGPGEALTTWCGERGVPTTLVADRGLEPIAVELGAATGTIAMKRNPVGWTLASNGCSVPMVTILGTVRAGAHAVAGVVCAGDEAFVVIGGSLFGRDAAPDGGGILIGAGDEGWDVIGGVGTSIDCGGWPDGVDRCELFGVESELFEALLPIPSAEAIGASAVDVVNVTDSSAEVAAWIGGETDPDEIARILVERLDDPDAEVPATVRRSDRTQDSGKHSVVVEIPRFDDAVRFETWAVWIASGDGAPDVRAFSWATCARGVTGDGLCV